jgi:miniconductance mechanosensitive channel
MVAFTRHAVEIYLLLAALLVTDALLTSVNDIYQKFEVSRRIPILGYLQVVKILITIVVIIMAISIVIDKSPVLLFSGLGALTAVILLIFKDSILGLVAGIQWVANDMVRPGDWIEMDKYGADGDVIEITLNTVKVQNWDKTITTIPTYALISDSFKNWRGMSESGGRRIKRSVYIDVGSIRFCTPEMIEKFSRIQVLKDYIARKQKELAEYNQTHGIDESELVNGRRMTNIGTFRAYLVEYLRRHPKIHQEMTFLIRHLQPTDKGLPLEVYVFSNDQVWANYEALQADIFDHIFASLPQFGLRPFQSPAGSDIAALGDALSRIGQS